MPKIAVFSFDAGGSELIASLQESKKDKYTFYNFSEPSAPFLKILKDDNITIESSPKKIISKLQEIQPDLIMTGTGWQSETYNIFLQYGKEHDIPTVSLIDHWTPYKKRFTRQLPDYLATFDEKSTALALEEGFEHVVQLKNYHLLHLQKRFEKINTPQSNQLLFLTEPTAEVAKKRFNESRYWGFDELDVFEEVKNFATKQELQLLIRLHPSDTKTRYQKLDPNAHFSSNTLLEDIAASEVIIGIDTVALYYAYLFGKKAIALMPTQKRDVVVPIPNSNILTTLQNLNISDIKRASPSAIEDNGIDFDIFVKKVLS